MTRIRKALVALSVVLAATAIQVPASADPGPGPCTVQEELAKYGWNLPLCAE